MYSPIGLTRMIPWTWAHWFFKSAVRSLTPGQRTWKSNSYSMENSQTTSGIWKGNMESNKTSKKKTVKKRQWKKDSIVGSLSLPPTVWGAEWHFLVPGQTCQWTELPNHPPAFAGSPLKEKMWCRETCSLLSLLLFD